MTSAPTRSPNASSALVSVVVCTRNRVDHIGPCVESILTNPWPDFELVVVDQSDGTETEERLKRCSSDPRFRYVRTATRGISRARNVGVASTHAPIIAFTDDDCRVDPDWLSRLGAVFEADSKVALIFGRVFLPSDFSTRGYAASFEPAQREYEHAFPPSTAEWGIGANMALRRAALARVGPFDPLLGVGGKFAAGEEFDLAIRVLAAGFKIVNASEASVLHLGLREGSDASKLLRSYGVGTGATLGKHARLGTKDTRRLLLDWIVRHGAQTAKRVASGARPSGLGYFLSLLSGVVRACGPSLDREQRVFSDEQQRPSALA